MKFSRQGSTFLGFGGAVALAVAFMACDSDKQPELRILNPTAGSAITMAADMKVPIVISANDFSLKAPADCAGDSRCGMLYVHIDGDACNQPGRPYNNVLADGKLGQDFVVDALFQFCSPGERFGTHNLTVSLRTPDGRPVIGEGGAPAQATISIVTKMP